MKLKAANMLELSLSIAFALVVLTTSLQLIQESTNRVNKGYTFKEFQEKSFKSLLRIHNNGQWNWNSSINPLTEMKSTLTDNSTLAISNYIFNNNQWITTTNNSDATKIIISNPLYTKSLSVFLTNYPSKQNLLGCLATIKIALDKYYQTYQFYPPNQQLNYLVQTNIIDYLPNNPYTVEDTMSSSNKNITDWHYSNNNGTITLFAYTHPNTQLSFQ